MLGTGQIGRCSTSARFSSLPGDPIPARVTAALLGGFVAATAIIGSVDFLRALGADRPADFFIRVGSAPPSATPTRMQHSSWRLSFRRCSSLPGAKLLFVLRGAMLACAGVAGRARDHVPESRVARRAPAGGPRFPCDYAGSPSLVACTVAVAAAAALGAGRLLDVYPAIIDGDGVPAAMTQARGVLAWSAVGLFVVGVAIALLDRRLRVTREASTCGWLDRGDRGHRRGGRRVDCGPGTLRRSARSCADSVARVQD